MTGFQIHDIASAPKESAPILDKVSHNLGFVPNLFGVMAEAPALLEAYSTLSGLFHKSSFTPTERLVVLLAVSAENHCGYCVAAHSTIAAVQRVPEAVVAAIRDGRPIDDNRLEALRSFARTLVQKRGFASDEDVQTFLTAGYTKRNVLEAVLGVGMKTLSNYTNHLAKTPVDSAFQPAGASQLH